MYPELEEKQGRAKRDFETADSENLIELGKRYLAILNEHRSKLLEHPAAPRTNLQPAPSTSWETVHNLKKLSKRR